MKTIGLLGGMSWESSIEYYRLINELIKEKLGGLHSAKSIMYSVDFEEIEKYQMNGEWEKAGHVLAQAAKDVENGGADFIILCTNTMHKVANQMEQAINIPMLHIADATAETITDHGIKKVGLLGTKYTMEQDFYKGRLIDRFGLKVIIPDKQEIDVINRVIFEELVLGIIKEESKQKYIKIIDKLINDGAEGIILGCTEIGLLINEGDASVPLFDTTYIHALKAVEVSLGK